MLIYFVSLNASFSVEESVSLNKNAVDGLIVASFADAVAYAETYPQETPGKLQIVTAEMSERDLASAATLALIGGTCDSQVVVTNIYEFANNDLRISRAEREKIVSVVREIWSSIKKRCETEKADNGKTSSALLSIQDFLGGINSDENGVAS